MVLSRLRESFLSPAAAGRLALSSLAQHHLGRIHDPDWVDFWTERPLTVGCKSVKCRLDFASRRIWVGGSPGPERSDFVRVAASAGILGLCLDDPAAAASEVIFVVRGAKLANSGNAGPRQHFQTLPGYEQFRTWAKTHAARADYFEVRPAIPRNRGQFVGASDRRRLGAATIANSLGFAFQAAYGSIDQYGVTIGRRRRGKALFGNTAHQQWPGSCRYRRAESCLDFAL